MGSGGLGSGRVWLSVARIGVFVVRAFWPVRIRCGTGGRGRRGELSMAQVVFGQSPVSTASVWLELVRNAVVRDSQESG